MAGQVVVVDGPLVALVVGGVDQAEVVDAGARDLAGVHAGDGVGVHAAAEHVGGGGAHGPSGVADVDVGQVERVEDQLDDAADQGGVDFVAVAVQRHGGGLGHAAGL